MKKACVLTPWIGNGGRRNTLRPKIADEFAIAQWVDVTSQPVARLPTIPNLFAVEITCAEQVFDAIETSQEYGDFVIWVEDA